MENNNSTINNNGKSRILLVNLVEMIEDGISALEAKLFDADGCVGLINCVV
ncbi:hypothetical protein SLEP1_g39735 [Rubroshorea leprosula]|uniref:Uncharacterized protein n=1 Tax=Rubroshorea leprosula TaxID=152421 RepID=A0AAV5L1M1_9ROSI|nr:hypothetical protein SLEP1_g39735 [Rubroshorea leprosula]